MLKGKRVLVTAGPTFEPIDPVRFIGNHSTGKMGYAIAKVLTQHGAEVVLVSGPSMLEKPEHVELIKVQTAQEMYEASLAVFDSVDAYVLSAAVADYRPEVVAIQKIKKSGETLDLKLVKNIDIAFELGKIKGNRIGVGFALETNDEFENAKGKLLRKNLDFIVLNSMRNQGTCFGADVNKISIIGQDYSFDFELKDKNKVAEDIVSHLNSIL